MLLKQNVEKAIQVATILIYILHTSAQGISCFKCYVSPPGNEESNQLCSQFDESSRYQVYCPTSTFCMKKTIYYRSNNVLTTTVQRDCAAQTYISRSYVDNRWYITQEIDKAAYYEGCFKGEDRGAPGGPSEYCYCNFHLCNMSPQRKLATIIDITFLSMILIRVF